MLFLFKNIFNGHVSMGKTIVVIGAGMVGTCTALHLQQRGFEVTLIDRREPGSETSFGNAGLIQREAVEPYAFPREFRFFGEMLLGCRADVHWHTKTLIRLMPVLLRYFHHSHPTRHAYATSAYSRLIERATIEHAHLMAQMDAEDLVRREGFRFVFRTQAALDAAVQRAEQLHAAFGVRHTALDGAALAAQEPALRLRLAGAVHWLDTWSINDPGALVKRYAEQATNSGVCLIKGDVQQLEFRGAAWRVHLKHQVIDAAQVVIALGPWSDGFIKALGYRFPLFIKRGYHQHYQQTVPLSLPLLDAEKGYVLAPMRQGLRLTTGAEFASMDAEPTPVQLKETLEWARDLVGVGEACASDPWVGARPCTADMLPVMGPAPHHKNLWLNFGHGHQGFTLGPVAGRLLAEMIAGQPTCVDPSAYAPSRFI
jgi:D-amino-acid dehydrogenase